MHFQTHIQDLIMDHDQQDGGGGHDDQQGDGGGHGSGAPVCKHPWPSSSQNTSVEPSTPVLKICGESTSIIKLNHLTEQSC